MEAKTRKNVRREFYFALLFLGMALADAREEFFEWVERKPWTAFTAAAIAVAVVVVVGIALKVIFLGPAGGS